MINEIQYTNIRRVLDNLHEHPLLSDVTLEQAVRYTIRFITFHAYTRMFQDKIETVEIHDFRGLLPCDLISIIQVKDVHSGICLKAMTDNFPKALEPPVPHGHPKDLLNNVRHPRNISEEYIPDAHIHYEEPSFKTQGRVIFTSFPEGCIEIAYKSIPVDEDGFPLLIDDENYLAALEAFIKMQVFTIKFDTGKINANVLQNVQQEYAWRSARLGSAYKTPSVSEAESLSRLWTTMILPMRHFDNGFKDLSNREYLRRH